MEKNCPHTSCFYIIPNYFHCFIGYVVNGGLDGKESACNAGGAGSTPGQENSLEKEMATHSSIFAWEIPWTEEPGMQQSMGLQRVRHNLVTEQ